MTETGTIEVRINGDDREIPHGLSVWGLLEWLDLNPALVVVEMNREILDREGYGERYVVEKDTLELVHFVGGG
ncbi:MAG: sulfur carrier protein ThiS [Longimicrobiales bacterium]|nr:sulfur carrier protein ThiS [Longimicrobiales bacterium]